MKVNKFFIASIAVLFVVLMVCDIMLPSSFVWEETYSHTSTEPFGNKFLDEMMEHSTPQGYTVSPLTISQWMEKDTAHMTYLIVASRINNSFPTKAVEKALKRGDNVVIATNYTVGYDLDEYLQLKFAGTLSFYMESAKRNAKRTTDYRWLSGKAPVSYPVPFSMKGGYLYDWDRGYEVIVDRNTDDQDVYYKDKDRKKVNGYIPVVLKRKKERGTLIVCGNPLLFTNYAVRRPAMCNLIMRIMSQVSEYPIVRLDPTLARSTTREEIKDSKFRVLLMHPPLRWALYLALFSLILGMLFTARRRQRVIPVIERPVNQAMAMVRHIGTLYFSRHDHVDLLAKKYMYFAEELRRRAMVDIDDDDHFDAEVDVLSQLTGLGRHTLVDTITRVRTVIDSGHEISDSELHQLIDSLNIILSNI